MVTKRVALRRGRTLMSTVIIKKPELKKEVNEVTIKSYWLSVGELRLDASYHSKGVSRAIELLEECGYKLVDIEQLSDEVFTLPRIKRFYGDAQATPYLMPSELFYFPLSPTKHVFADKIENVERWFLKEGWLIITCSGRLGKSLIVTRTYEGYIVSHDLVRVVPKEETLVGYLHAYLSTWMGKALLTKDQYGVAVDHIEPHHVKSVKIPSLPKEIQKIIHSNIMKAFNLREKARNLLVESKDALSKELELSEIEKHVRIKPFSVRSSELRLRFDVSYHNPLIKHIREELRRCKYKSRNLEHGIREPFFPNRFKRVYVEKEYGVPFLSGTNIVQIKPYDLKYLSKRVTTQLEDCLVRNGWVLVTRSGTVGRIALVPSGWDGWAITEHVMRLIPIPKKIHSGFLVAFLQTEYGHLQVVSKIYGGVVDELAEDDVKDIVIPLPPIDIQERIGNLVVEAYELRGLANKIESETVKTLENMLSSHKRIELDEEYLKEINAYADSFDLIGDEEFRKGLDQARRGDLVPYDF